LILDPEFDESEDVEFAFVESAFVEGGLLEEEFSETEFPLESSVLAMTLALRAFRF
jgi:hypothetical protein